MYLGLDIGGSKIIIILFDPVRKKVIKKMIEITPKTKSDFLDLIFSLIERLNCREVKGIGVGVAGTLDFQKEKILKSFNLSFLDGLPLKKILLNQFKIPVLIDNDACCFTRGEAFYGAAQNCCSVVGLTLGTGIGSGILMNGKIIEGAYGSAGEIGHMIIKAQYNGMAENLSFEDLASKKGIKRLIDLPADKLIKELKGGNDKIKDIFDEFGFYLGIGLANLVNILNPEIIVIGGGLSNLGNYILKPAKESMKKFIISPAAKKVKIKKSQLGESATAIGAASLFSK